jgi:predicted GNAT family acetyltransferase
MADKRTAVRLRGEAGAGPPYRVRQVARSGASDERDAAMAEVITDNADRRRFELLVDGELAALVAYGNKGGMLALTHTETEDGFGGQGYATKLVEWVLEAAREQELQVLPFCPFVHHYMETHPEAQSLVPDRLLGAFGFAARTS